MFEMKIVHIVGKSCHLVYMLLSKKSGSANLVNVFTSILPIFYQFLRLAVWDNRDLKRVLADLDCQLPSIPVSQPEQSPALLHSESSRLQPLRSHQFVLALLQHVQLSDKIATDVLGEFRIVSRSLYARGLTLLRFTGLLRFIYHNNSTLVSEISTADIKFFFGIQAEYLMPQVDLSTCCCVPVYLLSLSL